MAAIITRAMNPALSTYAAPKGVYRGDFNTMRSISREIVVFRVRGRWAHLPFRPYLEDTTDWGFEKWLEKKQEREEWDEALYQGA